MTGLKHCYNIADLRAAARKRLPRGVFEYIDRGSEDEVALRGNAEALKRLKLKTRVLVDLTVRDLGVDLFGARAELPMAIGPTGVAGLCWYEGELLLAKAAAKFGIPFTLATGSITSMEKIAREVQGRLWFQLYMWKETELSFELVDRARDAGFETLIVTVDSALGANREYNRRNGFNIPFVPSRRACADMMRHPRWLTGVMARYLMTTGMPRHENYPEKYRYRITAGFGRGKPLRYVSMTWTDIARLREKWKKPLIVKGVLSEEDAELALRHGADGIVVSNHGGRALDCAEPSVDALARIASTVAGKTTVFFDGGVRRGSDVVKALALGAKAALIGRPTLYGISVAGQAGAECALQILRTEFEKTIAYIGCTNVDQISSDVLVRDRRREPELEYADA